jgi:hypothetical protein
MNEGSALAVQLAREHRERRARWDAQAVREARPVVEEPKPEPEPVVVNPFTAPARSFTEEMEAQEKFRAHRAALSRMPSLVREVTEAVCERFGVGADEVIAEGRRMKPLRARQVAIHLTMWKSERKTPPWSLGKIGRSFGRDHTTVLSDDRRVKALILEDAALAEAVAGLKQRLGEG